MSEQPFVNPILGWFAFEHLPEGLPREISMNFSGFVNALDENIDDGPEKAAGLRKMLEAKDCFVRAGIMTMQRAMIEAQAEGETPTEEEEFAAKVELLRANGASVCPPCLLKRHDLCEQKIPVGVNDTIPCACVNTSCGVS